MLELVPPNLNYRYFENSDFFPFRPHFEDYCRINAWWLSEFSLLAYADPAFIYTKVRETNTFEIPDEGFFSNGTSQGFIAQSDDAVVIVFRGTELGKLFLNFQEFWADFCADINVELIPWRQGGWVHKGFSQAFDLVWKQIEPILSRILKANPNRTVWFTGHSLGAALATLAASRFSSNSILYSFGSPCVGDDNFRRSFLGRAFRIVNDDDLVTDLPPHQGTHPNSSSIFDFVHVGRLIRFVDDPSHPEFDLDLGRLIFANSLFDHAPIHYCRKLKPSLG